MDEAQVKKIVEDAVAKLATELVSIKQQLGKNVAATPAITPTAFNPPANATVRHIELINKALKA